MPADGVADDLDERLHVDVVELPAEPGRRVRLPISERVAVASSPRSTPSSSFRRWKARKSEHCFPSTSMTWMYSPARTSYASAVAASTRKSSRGSASGAGSSSCPYVRGEARRISTSSSDGGGAPSTIRPAGAAHDDHDRPLGAERLRRSGRRRLPKSRTACAPSGRARRGELAARNPFPFADELAEHRRRRIRARAERGGVVGAVGREHRHLGDLAAVRVDDGQPLVRLERDDGRAAGPHEVRLEERDPRREQRSPVDRREPDIRLAARAPSPPPRRPRPRASRRARACRPRRAS